MDSRQSGDKGLVLTFFDLACRLHAAKTVKALDALDQALCDFGNRVQDPKRLTANKAMNECENAFLLLLLRMLDKKNKSFKRDINEDFYKSNLDLLACSPYLDRSQDPQIRALYYYVVVSVAVMRLPDRLNNLSLPAIRTALQQAFFVVSVASAHVKQSTRDFKDVAIGKDGFKLFFNENANHTTIDRYVDTVLSDYVAKVISWRDDLVDLKKKSEANVKSKKNKNHRSESLNKDEVITDCLVWIDGLIRKINLSHCKSARNQYIKEAIKVTQEKGVLRVQDVTLGFGISRPDKYFQVAIHSLQKKIGEIDMLFNAHGMSGGDQRKLLEMQLLRYLYKLMMEVNLLYVMFNVELMGKFNPDNYGEIERDINVYNCLISSLIYHLVGKEERETQHSVVSNIVVMRIDGVSTEDIPLLYQETDSLSSVVSQYLAARAGRQYEHARQMGVAKECMEVIRAQIVTLLDKQRQLGEAQRILTAGIILDYYYACLLMCEEPEVIKLFIDNKLDKQILDLTKETPNEHIHKFLHFLIIGMKIYSVQPGDVNQKYYLGLTTIEQFTMNHHATFGVRVLRTNRPRMHAGLHAMFVEQASVLLRINENENKALLKQLDAFKVDIANASTLSGQYLDEQLLGMEPVKTINVSRSFIPDAMPQKPVTNKGQKNKKKKKREPEAKSHRPLVTVQSRFSEVADYCDNQPGKIRQFYESVLYSSRQSGLHVYALLGLANCLALMSDAKKARILAAKLLDQSKSVFSSCASSVTMAEQLDVMRKEFEDKLSPWRVKPEDLQVKVVGHSAPAVVKKPDSQHKPKLKNSNLTSVSLFREPARAVEPRVSKPVVKKVEKSLPLFNSMIPGNQADPLRIPFTGAQLSVLRMLCEKGHDPLIHGGAVLAALFGTKPRDIDALCFADMKQMTQTLEANREKLNIAYLAPIDKTQVIVITFHEKQPNGDPVQLDLLCLGSCKQNAREEKLRQLARNYGINGLYCRPFSGEVVDPTRQYERLYYDRTFDVAQLFGVNIDEYFSENPARICDLVNKIAGFRKHGIAFGISDVLKEAVDKNRLAIKPAQGGKFTLTRFNKLFLRGYARHSFDVLDKMFDLISVLFPITEPSDLALLRQVCVRIDNEIAQYQHDLNAEKMSQHGVAFLADYILAMLLKHYPYDLLSRNPEETSVVVSATMSRIHFKFEQTMYFYVQSKIMEKIQLACEAPRAEGAALSF